MKAEARSAADWLRTCPGMTERWRTGLFSRCSADALVAERQTGHPLIEADGRRSIECVTPDHIYEVVFIEFRLTAGLGRPVRP